MIVNELMINDWVLDTFDKPLRVRDIITFDNKYSAKRYVNGNSLEGGGAYCQREENIKPIPLTSEILEKNGFVGEGDIFKMWISADKRVILHNNDKYINSFNKWHVHVYTEDMRTIGNIELTYVHQLQQFLRFCGLDDKANNFKV